jgi:hypothetical protein
MQEAQRPNVTQAERDDQWLDEVLSQTFPASDPVPLGHRGASATEAIENCRRHSSQS